MSKRAFLIFILGSVACGLGVIAGFSQDAVTPVTIDGDEINYLQGESRLTAKGNVKMEYQDTQLFCDQASYDADNNIAHLTGNIKIVKEGSTIYGDNIIYDFNTAIAKMVETKIEFPPFYGRAQEVKKVQEEKYVLSDGHITTCDLDDPHYRLTAQQVIAYPKVKMVAKNMILKIGKIPVLYIPYCVMPLDDDSFPFEFSPGKNSDWGNYVLARWRYNLNSENRGKVHLDLYEDRGQGLGLTHKLASKRWGQSLLNYYLIEDEDYELEERYGFFEKYPEREGIDDKYLEDDRFKAQASYSHQLTPRLSLIAEVHKFSDQYFMKDFFEREYEIEPHPLSYALADYTLDGSTLSLLAQKRANHFWSETEYLPQLEYNFYRQKLNETNLYFQSTTTIGNLTYKYANSDVDHDAIRCYSDNTLSYPASIGWLSITPYVGGYAAFYSKDILGREEVTRMAHKSGATLSTKLYKIFDFDSTWLGTYVEKLRHVITPTFSYGYVHEPTIASSRLFRFDKRDSLGRAETVTFTLYNKLQTKKEEAVRDILYFSPAVDYQINQEGAGSYFDKITSDFEFYPGPGVSLGVDTAYDCPTRSFDTINADIGLHDAKNSKYSASLGQRYAHEDSNQSTFALSYQLTPKVQFKNYLRFEHDKEDEFKEQQYGLRLDLHCWWMDLGLDIDKKENNDKEYSFWVIFTIKDFPDVNFGFDHSYRGVKDEY